jgi:hypothetical protein
MDLSEKKGRIDIKLNGTPTSYTEGIKDGDNIEITWI